MEHPCSPPVPKLDALARDRSVTRSLCARADYVLIGASLLAGAGLAVLLCFPEFVPPAVRPHVDLGGSPWRLALPIAVLPLMLTLISIGAVLNPWRSRRALRWLARLPFPFAHRGYLTALKREPGTNALQLLLVFDHVPGQDDFALLCKRRVPRSKLVWQDDNTVMVRSPPELATTGSYTRGIYNNARLHHWFQAVAAPFLIDLHRKAGLKKVELRT